MPDPRFAQSVVFLCAHNEEGAMGLIINKFMGAMKASEILDADHYDVSEANDRLPVHFGGPVEGHRGFVLHTAEYSEDSATMPVNEHFSMTATLSVVDEINRGCGPQLALLASLVTLPARFRICF